MAKVVFEFPSDAWDGICEAFAARRNRPEKVPNPQFVIGKPESDENPREIDNPETKEQFAFRSVLEYVEAEWSIFSKEQALAATKEKVNEGAKARAAEVRAATKVSVQV